MPIDFSNSLNSTKAFAFGSKFLNSVLSSSIFMAILISLVMIFIIMIMYPARSGTSFAVIAKMFVYMFAVTLMLTFLHDGVLHFTWDEESVNQEQDQFINGTIITNRDPTYNGVKTMEQTVPDTIPVATPAETPKQIVASDTVTGGRVLNASRSSGPAKNPYR